MEVFSYPLIAVGALILLGTAAAILFKKSPTGRKNKKQKKKIKSKDRNKILRKADKRLAQNPKDPDAHLSLAALYYEEKNYEQALKHYKICIDLCATVPGINEFEVTLRHALSALMLKQYEDAYKSFMIARTFDGENFEVNYNLGYLEYMRKNFQRSAPYLEKAYAVNPQHAATNRYLGHSYYRLKKYKRSISSLQRTYEYEPEDKNSLFVLGQSYYELAQLNFALNIFSHLRADSTLGAGASLYAGIIHFKTKQYQKAIMDFEIGLRHENTPKETVNELKYRLAAAYLNQGDVSSAITRWKEIQESQPDYKDVKEQLNKYLEINKDRQMQVFLMASSSEFAGLCKRIAVIYFPNSNTKLLDISLYKNEYADIFAEVNTRQWDDFILFRFLRTTGAIGDLMVREFHSRTKDLKAGRGICITCGTFSDTARSFVEARLIDLVEKEELLKLFKRLSSDF